MVEAGGEAASTSGGSLTKRLNNEKLSPSGRDSAAQSPKQSKLTCPSCGDSRIVKGGLRETRHGEVQRFYCKSCGYRFSLNHQRVPIPPPAGIPHSRTSKQRMPFRSCYPEKNIDIYQHVERIDTKILRLQPPTSNRRVCDERSGSRKEHGSPVQMKHIGSGRAGVLQTTEDRNLARVETRQKRAAGATEITDADVKGKIIEYAWWMQKQGYKLSTIKPRTQIIQRLARLGADLLNPENIKDVIARQTNWGDGYKHNMAVAYSSFLKMLGKTWDPPRYRIPESFPFIPLESEIDALINSCGKKIACFLQGLKDCGADPGELACLEWTDVNIEAKSVTIRHPVKGHNSRVIPVSDAFLRRLNAMPKNGNRIFCTVRGLRSNFISQRRHCARDLSNPRILKITFITFRHFKGTMEYHKTKDIIHVKQLLGHKCIQSTMIYINLEAALFQAESDEFTVRVAKTLDEACSLVEAGFDYVTDMEGGKIFRHRK